MPLKLLATRIKVLPTLLLIAILASMFGSPLFFYRSLTPYFGLTLCVALFVILLGWALLKNQLGNINIYCLAALLLPIIYIAFVPFSAYTALHPYRSYLCYTLIGLLSVTLLLSGRKAEWPTIYMLIVVTASVEVLFCTGQLLGFIPVHNILFKVTGSLDNPNITAMFLTMAMPSVFYLLASGNPFVRKIVIIVAVLISIFLLILECRTAIIGFLLVCVSFLGERYQFKQKFKNMSLSQKALSAVLSLFILTLLGAFLYLKKKDSADGRLLIYKISVAMLNKKPLSGVGFGQFEKEYNLAQADYLTTGDPAQSELSRADYVKMAYNEYLAILIEGGVMALFSFLPLFVLSLRKVPGGQIENQWPEGHWKIRDGFPAWSAILVFLTMSLVNFTIQAIPVMCLAIIYLAIRLSSLPALRPMPVRFNSGLSFLRTATGLLVVAAGSVMFYFQARVMMANYQNKQAALLIQDKQFDRAEHLLAPLESRLSMFESYWMNYGDLFVAKQSFDKALHCYEKAKLLTSNPELYHRIAYCFERRKLPMKAAAQYQLAATLGPRRLKSRYALLRFYCSTGDSVKIVKWAREILKIGSSQKTDIALYYKRQAEQTLQNFGISEYAVPDFPKMIPVTTKAYN